MLNSGSINAASARLAAQSDAVARLAKDAGAFAAVVAAFEAEDGDAVRWVLDRLELYPYCELICEWLRLKLCTVRCVEVCGPPRPEIELPPLRAFADALISLSQHETAVRRLTDAVACGDSETYHHILAELRLEPFCHLICRWICSIRYERICEIVCGPRGHLPTDPAADVLAAIHALQAAANREALQRLGEAAIELVCEEAQQALGAALHGHCEIICRLICIWRTVFVCRLLCRRPVPVLAGAYAVAEAREFALAAQALAGQPRIATALVQAVAARDEKAYGAAVARLGLELYCYQLCGWVGSLVCYEFCICICPNPTQQAPEWTNIGYILVDSDIDATGRTTVARSGAGGVGYAFLGSLQLTGYCAATSSITPGTAMMYRFLYAENGGGTTPIVDGMLDPNPFQVAGLPAQLWPAKDASGNATATNVVTNGGAVFVSNSGDVPFPHGASPAIRPAPGVGDPWYPPAVYVFPDAVTGWIQVYQNTYAGFFSGFLNLNSQTIQAGQNPNTGFVLTDIGHPIPGPATLNGENLTLTFEATRITNPASPDYQQTPVLIRLNNNFEVNQLYFQQFLDGGEGCCTPITSDVTVLISADHEEMSPLSLVITSCALSMPITLLPTGSPPATLHLVARGGYGSVDQTITSGPCSYTVTLTTLPLLTTGIVNRSAYNNSLTFCICGA